MRKLFFLPPLPIAYIIRSGLGFLLYLMLDWIIHWYANILGLWGQKTYGFPRKVFPFEGKQVNARTILEGSLAPPYLTLLLYYSNCMLKEKKMRISKCHSLLDFFFHYATHLTFLLLIYLLASSCWHDLTGWDLLNHPFKAINWIYVTGIIYYVVVSIHHNTMIYIWLITRRTFSFSFFSLQWKQKADKDRFMHPVFPSNNIIHL